VALGIVLLLLGGAGFGVLVSYASEGCTLNVGCFALPLLLLGGWVGLTGRKYYLGLPARVKLLENASLASGIFLILMAFFLAYVAYKIGGAGRWLSWYTLGVSGTPFLLGLGFLFAAWLAHRGAEDYFLWRFSIEKKPEEKLPQSIPVPEPIKSSPEPSQERLDFAERTSEIDLNEPDYPLPISIAGGISLVLGLVIALGVTGVLAFQGMAGPLGLCSLGAAVFTLFFGVWLTTIGVEWLNGKSTNGVSIPIILLLIGFLTGLLTLCFVSLLGINFQGGYEESLFVAGVLIVSILFVVIAILSRIGDDQYTRWKQFQLVKKHERESP